ncbi:ABC transporter ATP-binding protein [Candidatus Pelagibacter bacterium]|jgi:iron(III) transport system ATP-binding protein|nr:ABC transporter ATP-binding protein [Candidatus Pelagibacter bacterium]
MSETIIEIKNINVSYGSNHVLKEVSLNIENKDFYTFLGPSGCGKTTLLRLIAGFEKSSSGELFIDGKEVSSLNPWERDVGMVFQNYALWPHMTVYKNISFGLEEKKIDKKEIKTRVDEVLELVDLKDLSGRYPFQLSGGQQQRVALARTLVVKPKVLLLDEPLSNLDAKLRVQMRKELQDLHKKIGITSIFVTHDQEEANSMSTNLAILNEGVVQQVGKPVDLYNNPENIFVANFLGTTNVIDGTFKNNNFTSSEGLEIKNIIDDKKGTNILLRPQNLYLHGDNNDFQNFEGIVINQEFLGNIVRYTVNVKNHLLTVDSLHEVNKKIYSLNEKIKIYLDPSKIKIL